MGQGESDFVGRENEMATLLSSLQALDAGQGRLLMLVGPPGIGKTRIAQEAVTRAQHLGALTLWGRCP
ncbi:MAG TPA: ATP-binding protein, partial [Rhodothermales bacterium]|nr:ATP-binding protein [Rhodothermales bacterium]